MLANQNKTKGKQKQIVKYFQWAFGWTGFSDVLGGAGEENREEFQS